jgi:hypothetical protein
MKKVFFWIFILAFILGNLGSYSLAQRGEENRGHRSDEVVEIKIIAPSVIEGSGKHEIKAQIIKGKEAVQEVEFYAKPSFSLQPIYLGKGEKTENEVKLEYDFKNLPNGEYQIYAKAKTDFGEIESEGKTIKVDLKEEVAPPGITSGTGPSISGRAPSEPIAIPEIVPPQKPTPPSEESSSAPKEMPWAEEGPRGPKPWVAQRVQLIQNAISQTQSAQNEVKTKVQTFLSSNPDLPQKAKEKLADLPRVLSKEKELEAKKINLDSKLTGKPMAGILPVPTSQPTPSLEERKEEIQEKAKEIQNLTPPPGKEDLAKRMSEDVKKAQEEIEKKIEEERKKLQEIDSNLTLTSEEKKKALEELKAEIEKNLPKERAETLKKEVDDLIKKIEEATKKAAQNKTFILEEDFDFDGLSNAKEIELGTDPLKADSDNDGFVDGVETQLGYDPKKVSPAKLLKAPDPRKILPKEVDKLKIEKVDTITIAEKPALKIEGKGLPGSFILIYIYSTPIVAMVKVDQNGNWVYILDKLPEPGEHEIYVVLQDNKGEVVARSEGFYFTLLAGNVIRLLPEVWAKEEKVVMPTERYYVFSKEVFILFVISLILVGISLALFAVGLVKRK